jgi:hypothetical protein
METRATLPDCQHLHSYTVAAALGLPVHRACSSVVRASA